MKENADRARALDSAELNKQLRESSEQMFRLRFQMSMGQMDGMKKLRSLRKERARMLTELRDRELHPDQAGQSPAAAPRAKAKPASKPTLKPKAAAAAKPAAEKPKKVAAAHKAAAKPKADSKPKAAPRARKSTKG